MKSTYWPYLAKGNESYDVFPLKAMKGGVLSRAGHTEAACDLAKLAGLQPAGVICEIMNEDGTMARRDDLIKFGKENNIKVGTIADRCVP